MIALTELRAPAVRLEWHEVAALVSEIAAIVRGRGTARVPDLSAIHLGPDGRLTLSDEGSDSAPVRQLATVLDGLLRVTAAPSPLRTVAARNLGEPPADATVEAFEAALSVFERPDRTAVLKHLAARAAAVDEGLRGAFALEQLASRVREEDATPPSGTIRDRAPRPWFRTAVFMSLVLVTAAAWLLLAYLLAPPSPGSRPVAARLRAEVTRVVESAKAAFGSPAPPSSEPAPTPVVSRSAASTARRGATRKPADASARPDLVVSWKELGGRPDAPPPHVAETVPLVPDASIYTIADRDVEPAVLLQPHLPSRPPAAVSLDEIGMLELTVTETGTVAHVTLLSPSNRYQERMLVAAAKAWRFQPALKNGRPVRFRTRVQITL